jgi:hypothetical protein
MGITFLVKGKPKTQGSKTAIYNPKARRSFVRDANPKTKVWRSDVRNEAPRLQVRVLPLPMF